MAKERDELGALWAPGDGILPFQTIYPLLNEWVSKYRPYYAFSTPFPRPLGPSTVSAASHYGPTSILCQDVHCAEYFAENQSQARAAFHIDSVEVVPVSEIREAATDTSHRMYNQDIKTIIADFDKHFVDRLASGRTLHPNYRMTMVVHTLSFHNGVNALACHKSWYFDGDSATDYLRQWRPPAGDWLEFLKETVATGKGWDRADIHF
ncbi:hypothetical protein DFH09DRAFT_1323686 [Mycena vulgaris]|nr:hypothetical protein DFH09DRAFT_1323686 [Mycena vulgaris]